MRLRVSYSVLLSAADDAVLEDIARGLTGASAVSLRPASGGANSRVFRVDTAGGSFALKVYPPTARPSGADRLRREFSVLRFLRDAGLACIPSPIASEPERGVALYEWIHGDPIEQHDVADVDAAVALLDGMHALRGLRDARDLDDAWEALRAPRDLVEHLRGRIERLSREADDAALLSFLERELTPELERRAQAAPTGEAAMERTLSPSDFSFHNALRRPDTTLVFLDFEYAGWDDPAKVSSDFLWHPAHRLSEAEGTRFRASVRNLYGSDPSFGARFDVVYPLFGLKWSLIVLNEFLPEAWERRKFSGDRSSWEAAKVRQLNKAAGLLATVKELA
jgi:aminoglycoside phosphotransferase (APT) family kinase protein